jgi:hypothetical protein
MAEKTTPERPADIRIPDFANPEFSDDVRQMMSAMAPMAAAIPWSLDAALEAAATEIGLDDFGEDIYSEPLRIFIEGARREAALSPMGEVTVWNQLTQFLKNRLLIEEAWKENPEIANIEVEKPIIIAGLPRTGTTHLHNLISADPQLRHLPWWESLEPVLPPAERDLDFEVDPRWQRSAVGIEMRDRMMPHFKRMHDMWPDHAHEEIHLLAIAGSTMFFETLALSESWREYYLATDQTAFYAYLKRVLQVLQFLRGGKRWILKSPQHLEQFGPLRRVFPDATFVLTHRDPVAITASFLTMMVYSARLSRDPVEPASVAAYWAERVEQLLRSCVEDREELPAGQSVDILFDEFMADDLGTVEGIYRLADQELGPRSREAMQAFMRAHPRGKHGRIGYDLADFGLAAEERRRALEFYRDRFDVRLERDWGRS